MGWMIYESCLMESKELNEDDKVLPDWREGQIFRNVDASLADYFTSPPKAYTDVIHFESRQWKYSKCKGAG